MSRGIALVTDSTAYLPDEVTARHDITVVPVQVVIGGTSLSGGAGTILGTIIGAFIMSVLTNGLRIMSVAQEWQTVVTGVIIILAVYADILRKRK